MDQLHNRSVEEVLEHHLKHLNSGDLEGTMLDYAPDAFIINMGGVVRGKDEISKFFADSIKNVLPPETTYEMLHKYFEGDMAYMVWTAESPYVSVPYGTDTFIIKNGLIVEQSFAGSIINK